MPSRKLALSGDPAADRLLSQSPLALLIGMVLDQQIPLEWAFKGPLVLQERMGGRLDARSIANADPDELAELFSRRPAIHRFPASNAGRVQDMCRVVVDEYDGKAERVWTTASSGEELLSRLKALPGFGDHKARIFVAFLAKQMGITPPGWEDAAGAFGRPGTFMSVADITGPETLTRVRAYKAEKKADAKRNAAAPRR